MRGPVQCEAKHSMVQPLWPLYVEVESAGWRLLHSGNLIILARHAGNFVVNLHCSKAWRSLASTAATDTEAKQPTALLDMHCVAQHSSRPARTLVCMRPHRMLGSPLTYNCRTKYIPGRDITPAVGHRTHSPSHLLHSSGSPSEVRTHPARWLGGCALNSPNIQTASRLGLRCTAYSCPAAHPAGCPLVS